MNFKNYQPLLEVIILSSLVYLAHKLVFFFNETNHKLQNFHFPIEVVYGFFRFCSYLLICLLIKVTRINIGNVCYTFLLVTCIEMALSYVVLSPILNSENSNVKYEKLNFFIIFALFLTIETIVTVRILNIKQ